MNIKHALLESFGDGQGTLATGSTEHRLVMEFVADIERMSRGGVADATPSLVIRAEDVLSSWLMVRRLEDVLRAEGVCRWDDSDETRPSPKCMGPHPMLEVLGKARERLRKALKEFEESCGCQGPGAEGGLGAAVQPLLRLGEGVMEDAIEFEARKKARKQSGPSKTGRDHCRRVAGGKRKRADLPQDPERKEADQKEAASS